MNRYEELRTNYIVNGEPISQRKLAKMIGIASPHISEIEKGRVPSLAEMKAYHKFFRVSYEYLLGETNNRVSADVFHKPPLNETKLEDMFRWLQGNECTPDQQIIKDTAIMLLTEEVGTLLLFYLGKTLNTDASFENIKYIIEKYKDGEFKRLSYNDMLLLLNHDSK